MNTIITQKDLITLKLKLLEVSEYTDKLLSESTDFINNSIDKLLFESIEKIYEILLCTECSLWSVNQNSTSNDGTKQTNGFRSASLIHRKCDYNFMEPEDFVHDIGECLFKKVIETFEAKNETFFYCNQQEAIQLGFRSKKFIEKLEINEFISVPIPSYSDNKEVIAILVCSYKNKIILDDNSRGVLEDLSQTFRSFFSSALQRYAIIKKLRIVNVITECQRERLNNTAPKLFETIILRMIKEFCPCEAASFFMWNNYQDRYNLIASSVGLPSVIPSDIYYMRGDGLTGKTAALHKTYIIDDIDKVVGKDYDYRWKEVEDIKTAMIIPIEGVHPHDGCIGILRFINKKNTCNKSFYDFFNDSDVEIFLSAAKYIALTVDFCIREEDQSNLIAKLSHEILTPAVSIEQTSKRLLEHFEEEDFMDKYLKKYLEAINESSELQRWQATTNLYLPRTNQQHIYQNKRISLIKILEQSKAIAKPIARNNHVKFDSICFNATIDWNLALFVDEQAFITVFYNLFTNAIKYHDRTNHNSFMVEVSYSINTDGLRLLVTDYGIGIDSNEANVIFEVGYRGKKAAKVNSNGFGVGLPVIKKIIEDFGGNLSINKLSSPTIFEISLPKSLIL